MVSIIHQIRVAAEVVTNFNSSDSDHLVLLRLMLELVEGEGTTK